MFYLSEMPTLMLIAFVAVEKDESFFVPIRFLLRKTILPLLLNSQMASRAEGFVLKYYVFWKWMVFSEDFQ